MHDKLKKLISEASDKELCVPYISEDGAAALADYLIAEGVIVPPCKVGDTVYYIDAFDFEPCKKSGQGGDVCPHLYAEYGFGYECLKGKLGAKPRDCTEIKSKRIGTLEELISYWDCFGESLFLTREEAEKALGRSVEK